MDFFGIIDLEETEIDALTSAIHYTNFKKELNSCINFKKRQKLEDKIMKLESHIKQIEKELTNQRF